MPHCFFHFLWSGGCDLAGLVAFGGLSPHIVFCGLWGHSFVPNVFRGFWLCSLLALSGLEGSVIQGVQNCAMAWSFPRILLPVYVLRSTV